MKIEVKGHKEEEEEFPKEKFRNAEMELTHDKEKVLAMMYGMALSACNSQASKSALDAWNKVLLATIKNNVPEVWLGNTFTGGQRVR